VPRAAWDRFQPARLERQMARKGGGAHLCPVDRAADVAPVLRDFLG
jgi:hypothetical protein